MRLPWRKVKSRRISQFVNDHIDNSRKRRDGSSLVVETGFPTSLVDLFMKNREKLKKKKSNIPSIEPDNHLPLVPSPSMNQVLPGESTAGEQIVTESDGVSNSEFMFCFKMIIVLFMLLRTNRLRTGIPLSAFLLFFLDHVIVSLLKKMIHWLESKGIQIQIKIMKHDTVMAESTASDPIQMKEHEPLTDQEEESKTKKSSKKWKIKSKLLRKLFSKRFEKNKSETTTESKNPCKDEEISDYEQQQQQVSESNEIETGDRSFVFVFTMFSIIIALVGLIVSRPFAVLLTVISCLMLKFGDKVLIFRVLKMKVLMDHTEEVSFL